MINSLSLAEQLLREIEVEALSKIIPSILPLALKCRDYKGYCVLSLLVTPIAKNAATNTIQTNELIRVLLLQGLATKDISKIVAESQEEFIELKSISSDQVSSHSLKELEMWIPEATGILGHIENVPRESYLNLSNRLEQIRRLYEVLRGYVVAKLTYYQQVLTLLNTQKTTPTQSTNNENRSKQKIFIVHGHNGEIKESLARLIEKQGIQAIILHEQANQGDTTRFVAAFFLLFQLGF